MNRLPYLNERVGQDQSSPSPPLQAPLGCWWGGDGAKADWLGQLIELSCLGKLNQPNVIDNSKTTISLVSGIILVDNKVPLIDLKFLNSRELVPLVVKGGAEVEHPQGHSELGQVLLLAVGSFNKDLRRYEHSRADPDVNILNIYKFFFKYLSNWQSYPSYI